MYNLILRTQVFKSDYWNKILLDILTYSLHTSRHHIIVSITYYDNIITIVDKISQNCFSPKNFTLQSLTSKRKPQSLIVPISEINNNINCLLLIVVY